MKSLAGITNSDAVIYEQSNTLNITDLNASMEGKDVTFNAYIAYVGEQVTTSVKVESTCDNCGFTTIVEGNGYVNPKLPKCPDCRVKMQEKTKLETVDMKEIYLQELPELTNHANPTGFMARVIKENIRHVANAKRVKVTATFKSFNSVERSAKQHNDVVLLVKNIEGLDEPRDTVLPPERINEIRAMIENDADFEKKLWRSYAPHLVGHEKIKESLMLAAVGGSEGVTRRTIINVCIAGNKSKGKSELVKWHSKLTGGVTVVGMTATKAGLGIGVVKLQNGTSIPKPGPLVQYSGKSVGVDELDKMHEEDQFALLECTEHEYVTNTKALTTGHEKLPARTIIIGGCNFKYGDWDEKLDISKNLAIHPALINRFALVWRVLNYDEYMNNTIADKVLQLTADEKPLFDEQTLRLYVNTVKNAKPGISRDGKLRIKEFFLKMSKDKSDIDIEVRQLEDFARMVTARAKWLLKSEADISDVEAVINLYKAMLESWGIDASQNVTQLKLPPTNLAKEHVLLSIIKSCENAEKNFNSADVIEKWSGTKWFTGPEEAARFFDRWIGEKILRNRDGSYHLSKY